MASERLTEGTLLNGRYRITRTLGQGGMGTVYLAEHVRLDTIVAIKEVRAQSGDQTQDRQDLDRCEHEARFLVRLNHPHLPKVTDAFIENDRFYLVMEYIEGVTLEALLRNREGQPLDVEQVIEWSLQVADVLSYLHSQDPPIIFRDMKPANVMLQPDGEIRLIDFGIARRFQPGANKDTSLLGSVGYSPPEQFGRHQTDMRSDIYAFGATLHHLLTGRDPAIQPFKFPPTRSLNPRVPESLSQLIAACVALEPEARPASAHEVAQGLMAARDDLILLRDLPALAAAGASVVPSQSSSSSGRRIVSSELAKVEAQRRRMQNRNTGRTTTRYVWGAVMAAILVLILCGGALAILKARGPARHRVLLPAAVPPATEATMPTIAPTSPQAAPSDDSSTITDLPPTDRSTISVAQGRLVLEQGTSLLPIYARGMVHGHAGSVATVAVFFYGVDGSPLYAVDRNSTFANVDGQLSIATRVNITMDEQPFAVTLEVPLRQFPPQALTANMKVRGLLKVDGQEFYTDMIDVSVPISPDQGTSTENPSTNPSSDTPPNTGTGEGAAPGNPNPSNSSGLMSGSSLQSRHP